MQSVPDNFVQKLLEIFCEELEWQNALVHNFNEELFDFLDVLMKEKEKDINNWELMKNVLMNKSELDINDF